MNTINSVNVRILSHRYITTNNTSHVPVLCRLHIVCFLKEAVEVPDGFKSDVHHELYDRIVGFPDPPGGLGNMNATQIV